MYTSFYIFSGTCENIYYNMLKLVLRLHFRHMYMIWCRWLHNNVHDGVANTGCNKYFVIIIGSTLLV